MSKGGHLSLRKGVNQYRRRVPAYAVAALGLNEVVKSLGTSHLAEAKRRRDELQVRYNRIFAEARAPKEGGSVAPPTPLIAEPPTQADMELVSQHLARLRERARQNFFLDPPSSNAERAHMQEDAGAWISILEDREDPRNDQRVDEVVRSVFTTRNRHFSGAFAGEIIRRGLLDIERERLARVEDRIELSGAAAVTMNLPAGPTFAEATADYLQVTKQKAAANGTNQKWVDKQLSHVELLREIIGPQTVISEVSFEACEKVQTILAKLPAHRSKRYAKLSLSEAIEAAARTDGALLSATTQNGYLTTLDGVLERAHRRGQITVNPAHGLKALKKNQIPPGERRLPFRPAQLASFFHGAYYRSCSTSPVPWMVDKKGWRFWMPLLCAFMGMRPNEVCQLRVHDLKCTEEGTVYLDFATSDDEDDEDATSKTAKTYSSRRRIPVHPELLAVGFGDFVLARQQKGAALLFPTLRPDRYGNVAKYALRRFREKFLTDEVKLETRQSFYSFRHSFRDALRAAGAPGEVLEGLAGWKQAGNTSDRYGDRANPDYTAPWMSKVNLPTVDLKFLCPRDPN